MTAARQNAFIVCIIVSSCRYTGTISSLCLMLFHLYFLFFPVMQGNFCVVWLIVGSVCLIKLH